MVHKRYVVQAGVLYIFADISKKVSRRERKAAKGMIKILRKSFTPKKLAFLVSFALLSFGFCVNSFAGTTDGVDANIDAAIHSSIEDYQIAGNASTQNISSQEEEKVANTALSENIDLLNADKFDGKKSDTDPDKSFNLSIPNSDNVFDSQNNIVESTYDNAISVFEFENSAILEDTITSNQSLESDEISSGSSSEISKNTTDSESVTETTTEEGRSSRRGSSGNGKSSGRATKNNSNNNNNNDSSNTNDSKRTENNNPDRKSTDTPDTQLDRSNDDNHSDKESTAPNGNGFDSNSDSQDGNGDNTNGSLPTENADNDNLPAENTGNVSVGAVNAADGENSAGTLPKTGSVANTGTITLFGLAIMAAGIWLASKKQKS